MIDLITGLPGNAKTLYTIGWVRDWALRENRPVFYSGIPELNLDWEEIDPTKWMEVPPKSIVVVDEAQRIFRNRSLGASPPKHVTDLETHRHLGIDLVFITQHPSLIDPAIRRLAGRHRHMVRIWGMEMSTVHKWDSVKDNCDKPASRKDSESTKWVFDKSLYKLYKSSEEHTMKRAVPLRAKLLLGAPFLVAAFVYFAYYQSIGKHKAAAEAAKTAAAVASSPSASSAGGRLPRPGGEKEFDPMADMKHFLQMNTPRIAGLPQTAPKYDKLTEPTRVPVPAMCIMFRGDCKCRTQQNTPMDVKYSMCVEFARNGFFQEFDPEGDRKASERTAASVEVIRGKGGQQGVQAAEADFGPRVVVMGVPPPESPHTPSVGQGAPAPQRNVNGGVNLAAPPVAGGM